MARSHFLTVMEEPSGVTHFRLNSSGLSREQISTDSRCIFSRELQHELVAVSQILPATRVTARLSGQGLRKHIALNGEDVPHQVARVNVPSW